jgi:hypothetical protein
LPTRPYMVASDAPVIGAGPLVVLVKINEVVNTSFVLAAKDFNGGALHYQIQSIPDPITCGYIIQLDGTVSCDYYFTRLGLLLSDN